MPLHDLPVELLLSIAESLESQRDFNAFVQINHHLYHLLNPFLYRCNVQQFGSSALLWAAERGQGKAARKLLEEEANIEAANDDGFTPLILAAANGHEEVVKLLLADDFVNPDSKCIDGWTPLLSAAARGHDAVVKLLLADSRVNPESKNIDGCTPLLSAAARGHDAVVKLLLADSRVNPD